MDWSIEISWLAAGGDTTAIDERSIEVLANEVHEHAGVVSWGDHSYSVRLSVEAPEVGKAVDVAVGNCHEAVTKAGLPTWPIATVLAQTPEALDIELSTPLYPSIVGVTELAEMLGVSKQRASELARSQSFPAPLTELASGPIWIQSNVRHFCETWERKPGRPRKKQTDTTKGVDLMEALKASVKAAKAPRQRGDQDSPAHESPKRDTA